MDIYRSGFVGSLVNDAAIWITEQSGSAKSLLVPFAGIGRSICTMAKYGRTIESWDTQVYSRCIIEGVFAATEAKTNVDKIRYRKGWMYETRSISKIDERCAGFIDWVADEGTELDKASLGSAIVRCTLMGRMGSWHANMEQFWKRFAWSRDYNTRWLHQPGTFVHHEESFFDGTLQEEYDYCMVDPPKIVAGGTDVYSARFDVLNKALHGKTEKLPVWKVKDVANSIHYIMQNVNAKKFAFLYVSDVSPTLEELQRLLGEYGDVENEIEFDHGNRSDYGFTLRRTQ